MYLFLFLGIIFGFLGYYSGNSALNITLHDSFYVFDNSIVFYYWNIYFFMVGGIYFYLKKNKTPIQLMIKCIHVTLTIISFGIDSYTGFSFIGLQGNYVTDNVNFYALMAQIIFVIAQIIFGFGIYKSFKINTSPQ